MEISPALQDSSSLYCVRNISQMEGSMWQYVGSMWQYVGSMWLPGPAVADWESH